MALGSKRPEALAWMGKLFPTRDNVLCRCPQVFIQGGAADTELTGQRGFRFAGLNTTPQLFYLAIAQDFFSPPVNAALFRQGNTLALPFTNQRPLEFRKRPHDR